MVNISEICIPSKGRGFITLPLIKKISSYENNEVHHGVSALSAGVHRVQRKQED